MSALRAVLCLPLLLCACNLLASEASPPVADAEALAFARRAESFYSALEQVPIPALWTYERPELYGYFTGRSAFDDYFASLAMQVRQATLRDGRVERFEITEFRMLGPDHAVVDLRLVGRHERELRFWEVELARTDTWRRVYGVWTVSPDRL